jgi:hypothetical protein
MDTLADQKLKVIQSAAKQVKRDMVEWLHSDDVGREDYMEEFEEKFEEAIALMRKVLKLIS